MFSRHNLSKAEFGVSIRSTRFLGKRADSLS